ncbi:hypothetical protein [Tropicimonas sp. IMCC34043]|uniref:hypothetical protein n=1 Tax=Tropicimonas sp. IMCC34043 TaxID=2248760 RepID=UPI000E279603|nr:hypothetical protein [Tropicimonas sp. IMCC34043]
MKNEPKTLARLSQITEALWLARSEKLQKAAEAEQALCATIDALRTEQRHALETLGEAANLDHGHLHSLSRWLKWSETECRNLNGRLARARAELSQERAAARLAFGKHRAVCELARHRR